MQCPSCGFENMPGIETCPACSASLSSKQAGQTVFPPRARNRSFRQRVSWGLPSRLRWTFENVRLRERMVEARLALAHGRSRVPALSSPRNLGLLLISMIPGVGQILTRQQHASVGRIILLSSVVALAFAALLYKTPIADALVYCVIGLSMHSVYATGERLQADAGGIDRRRLRSLGVALLVVAAYLGAYVGLRLAISPVAMFAQVADTELVENIRSGDSLLLLRRGDLTRGDIVLARARGRDYLLGPIAGLPGDRIRVSDRVYLNGRPLLSPRWSMPVLYGYSSEIRLGRNEYWIQPDVRWPHDTVVMEQADDFVRLMADGGMVQRSEILGRAVAVTGPPSHRTILRRVSVTR